MSLGRKSRLPSARYVIQHHTGQGDDHYDLMLQHGDVLWTWRIERMLEPSGGPTDAQRISDHRLAYLTFEGQVRGGLLGACRIAAAGEMRWLDCGAERIVIELTDGLAAGRYELVRVEGRPGWWRVAPAG